MRKLYKSIQEKLDTINFNKLYPNFKRYPFALYDNEYIYLENETIPYHESFKGNTAIVYQGQFIAIWNLAYALDDIEIFVSKIVHEMFHCFQRENNETRWANEMDALDYDLSHKHMMLKQNEIYFLLEAYTHHSRLALEKFMKVRSDRITLFEKEVIYDSKTETIEGLAVYIEQLALKQVNEKSYKKAIDLSIEYLKIQKNILQTRLTSYHMGTILLHILEKLHIYIQHVIGKESNPIWMLLNDIIKPYNQKIDYVSFNSLYIEEYLNIQRNHLDSIRLKTKEFIYPTKIIGLDPMNTYKIDNFIVFNHFVMVEVNEMVETILGESYIELNEDKTIKYLKRI